MIQKNVFKTPYQEFIYTRTYSRWLEEEGRRETWKETVTRYKDFFLPYVPEPFISDYLDAIYRVYCLDIMPSMRALWTAGPALERDNVAGYNCAYLNIDSIESFSEILYILMCGTGIGFSTERQFINKLPEVPELLEEVDIVCTVDDNRIGWANALRSYLTFLYEGLIINVDYSQIRPEGARLKTFGGRASGPEPLKELFKFILNIFQGARGRKLNSIECYDIVCKIANIVIVGGVRRAATMNLSNLSDTRMRNAKQGQFWIENPQRALSNNSVAYTEKPEPDIFLEEWLSLMRSGTGERGICNREGLKKAAIEADRDSNYDFGLNPCGEIILRPMQFCNLTEVVVRPKDSYNILKNKVEYATILGILQSTLTDFRFLRPEWKRNSEEERLLGVSLTGLKDHELLSKKSDEAEFILGNLRIHAYITAEKWSRALGINKPKAITCVKPSGTVSQLTDTASGIHPRYSKYYIRRVRVSKTDPLCQFLIDKGVPCSPEVGETWENYSTAVFEFPCKSPDTSVIRGEETAIEQLEYWKMLKEYWCDHNPSCTVYVKPDEWLDVGAWVYKNFDLIAGLSFLPYDGGVYRLAPYGPISKKSYEELLTKMPAIDFKELTSYEKEDTTKGAKEYACIGGACEII